MHLTTSSALWSRRHLDAVLWQAPRTSVPFMLPLRAEGSASVPAVVCAFCATSLAATSLVAMSPVATSLVATSLSQSSIHYTLFPLLKIQTYAICQILYDNVLRDRTI